MTTGWIVKDVNLEDQEVTFQKKAPSDIKIEAQPPEIKRRRKKLTESFKALSRKRVRRRPVPSKTKIAKVQAVVKNIERKAAVTRYRGKLKPRKAYEKRLYKPQEKPET